MLIAISATQVAREQPSDLTSGGSELALQSSHSQHCMFPRSIICLPHTFLQYDSTMYSDLESDDSAANDQTFGSPTPSSDDSDQERPRRTSKERFYDEEQRGRKFYDYEPSSDIEGGVAAGIDSTDSSLDGQGEEEIVQPVPTFPPASEWCKCGACVTQQTTEHDNRCCKDDSQEQELKDRLEEEEGSCITLHTKFSTLCTDETVLRVVEVYLRYLKDKPTNNRYDEKMRHIAYRQFTSWVYGSPFSPHVLQWIAAVDLREKCERE